VLLSSRMNTKTFLAIIILVILIGGGYFFYKNQYSTGQSAVPADTSNIQNSPTATQTIPSQAAPTTQQAAQQPTIAYSSNGFSPKSITVKVGTTVTWINNDTDPLWVASNPHPIHTDLSGFDALKGYAPGTSYTYTFTKVGKWGYHNHMSPSNTGEVIVEN
jgi:plastocyanin